MLSALPASASSSSSSASSAAVAAALLAQATAAFGGLMVVVALGTYAVGRRIAGLSNPPPALVPLAVLAAGLSSPVTPAVPAAAAMLLALEAVCCGILLRNLRLLV